MIFGTVTSDSTVVVLLHKLT